MGACVSCRSGEAAEFTPSQRLARGIALHSCEYLMGEGDGGGGGGSAAQGAAGWHFRAPLPAWAGEVVRLGGGGST